MAVLLAEQREVLTAALPDANCEPRRTFGFVQKYSGQEQGGRNDLAGLGQLIATHRPDYIFLQEVMVTREQLEGQDRQSAVLA